MALTSSSGVAVETYRYTAFGRMKVYEDDATTELTSGTDYGNPYGYTGRRWDAEAGLWYYRAREYHPGLGRFLQRDPAGYVDGLNLYAYVANNPLAYVDPSGTLKQGEYPTLQTIQEVKRSQVPDENAWEDLKRRKKGASEGWMKAHQCVWLYWPDDYDRFAIWDVRYQQYIPLSKAEEYTQNLTETRSVHNMIDRVREGRQGIADLVYYYNNVRNSDVMEQRAAIRVGEEMLGLMKEKAKSAPPNVALGMAQGLADIPSFGGRLFDVNLGRYATDEETFNTSRTVTHFGMAAAAVPKVGQLLGGAGAAIKGAASRAGTWALPKLGAYAAGAYELTRRSSGFLQGSYRAAAETQIGQGIARVLSSPPFRGARNWATEGWTSLKELGGTLAPVAHRAYNALAPLGENANMITMELTSNPRYASAYNFVSGLSSPPGSRNVSGTTSEALGHAANVLSYHSAPLSLTASGAWDIDLNGATAGSWCNSLDGLPRGDFRGARISDK